MALPSLRVVPARDDRDESDSDGQGAAMRPRD
jgi:hypothetical protein